MEIETQRHEGCDRIVLRGDVFASDVPMLESTLQRLLDVGRYRILIDMRACTYISSAGLSLLINFANTCRRWNRGDLCLISPHETVLNLLQLAGLLGEDHSFFRIFDTVEEGIAALDDSSR